MTNPMTNKLALVKKIHINTHTHIYTKETKPKPTGPSSPVRTALI